MSPDKDFEQNMNQLIQLLKKIIKGLPSQGPFAQFGGPQMKESGINLNLCFFTFLAMSEEELDQLEEAYENFGFPDEKVEDAASELSSADLEFLRRHGIRF